MGEQKAKTDELFPIVSSTPKTAGAVSGIARLASCGAAAGEGHLVEFRTLPARSLLNNSVSRRGGWFSKTINPYRGCEFGCRYCYARYTHEFMEMKDPADFERKIYIKQNAAWLLRQELRSLRPGEEIALGTATDPWQPIERRARVTRSILEVLAEYRDLQIGVVTKSTLIERDIDLLQRIRERSRLVLHITITTPDARLARVLEPRAPRPDLRFRTVKRLRKAGLRTGILCSPLMPGITDNAKALNAMCRLASGAGASFLSAQPLFLKPCSKATFLAFVHEHFPELDASYASRYEAGAFVSKAYQRRISDLVAAVTRKYGLSPRFAEETSARTPEPAQGELWPSWPSKREAHSAAVPQRVMRTS
ncbi:MAG TPA: radical SAM protein [Silvibacterium sp.]|nr:radical SAM protein [Silvibacterium sp.]